MRNVSREKIRCQTKIWKKYDKGTNVTMERVNRPTPLNSLFAPDSCLLSDSVPISLSSLSLTKRNQVAFSLPRDIE